MRRCLGLALIALGVVAAGDARGDGLPVTGVDASRGGVTTPRSAVRYVTLRARHRTVVAAVRRHGGAVQRSRVLRGAFTIPAVALDARPGGLSADGGTLVLIRPRPAFPRARTRFAVLDARRLAPRRIVTLDGDFSFDALSPDGATLYLIEYTSRRDPTRYAVRAMDLRSGRLLRAPIVDPREPDERMRGYPLTRATSEDGRWEYTLYDGAGSHPFVHALDTVEGTAACIDLDALTGYDDLPGLRLALATGRLIVRTRTGQPLAVIDRATFRVSDPPAPRRRVATREAGSTPWVPITAAAVLLAGIALVARRRRRRTGAVVPA
jgi:hypothetical protein